MLYPYLFIFVYSRNCSVRVLRVLLIAFKCFVNCFIVLYIHFIGIFLYSLFFEFILDVILIKRKIMSGKELYTSELKID